VKSFESSFADILNEKIQGLCERAATEQTRGLFSQAQTWMDSALWAQNRAAGHDIKTTQGHPSSFLAATTPGTKNSRRETPSFATPKPDTFRDPELSIFVELHSLDPSQRMAIIELERMGAKFGENAVRLCLADLKKEWRRIARKTHPDTLRGSTESFVRARAAYQKILRAFETRKAA
jgi:hypothetical protein